MVPGAPVVHVGDASVYMQAVLVHRRLCCYHFIFLAFWYTSGKPWPRRCQDGAANRSQRKMKKMRIPLPPSRRMGDLLERFCAIAAENW